MMMAIVAVAVNGDTIFDPVDRLLARVSGSRPNVTYEEFEQVYEHVVVERAVVAFGEEEQHDGHEHRVGGSRHVKKSVAVVIARAEQTSCYSAEDLFKSSDVNGDGVLSNIEMAEAFSAMGAMRVASCFVASCNVKPTSAQVWGFGFLSVIIITLVGFVAVVILPVKSARIAHHVLTTLVAFGFGAIAGDTIFHILPVLFALHDHSEGVSGATDRNAFSYRMAVVMAAFLLFYGMDRLISAYFAVRGIVHTHTHTADGNSHEDEHSSESERSTSNSGLSTEDTEVIKEATVLNLHAITSLGWMNLFSDGVHNFVDGLALGAAWSVSLSLGLGTALAILFHEIPQEISDFSILVRAGFPRRWALVVNFLSGLPAIIGLVIAIPIAESAQDAQIWVLAITAGGFFYISFVLLIPDLLSRKLSLLHQLEVTFGMTVGFLALILIAVYEDDIVFGFCIQ